MSKLMNIKRIAAAALALGVLAGCGGGGGGGGSVKKSGEPVALEPGVYVDPTVANRVVTLAILSASGGLRPWYGFRPTSSSPVIYRGEVDSLTLRGAANSTRAYLDAAHYDGTAAFTATTATTLTGTLTIPTTDNNSSLIATQATALLLEDLNLKDAQGIWTINEESAGAQTVHLTVSGSTLGARIDRFLGCSVTVVLTNRAESGVYNAALTFEQDVLNLPKSCSVLDAQNPSVVFRGLLMTYRFGTPPVKHVRLVAFNSANTQSVSFSAVLP